MRCQWLQLRSLAVAKKNKAEGIKAQKGGHKMWTEVTELAELIRYVANTEICALVASFVYFQTIADLFCGSWTIF